MKVAIVHDYLNQYGGAERVLQVLCALWPDAPIYAVLYDADATGHILDDRIVRTTFVQRLPASRRYHYLYLPLMPMAVERMDLDAFDLVISVSASFAKGVICRTQTRHVSYCLTPPRFLWDQSQRIVDEFVAPWPVRSLLPPLLTYLRVWDQQAAQRPEHMLATSQFIQNRIATYYRRDASVVYPPVNIEKFPISRERGDYFLMVGRMVPYKKMDIAIEAFNRLKMPLVIVGTGTDERHLRRLAGPTIKFTGPVDDFTLAQLYASSRAVIFPQEEDFGIVPLEAMASGRPVVAYHSGGACETVIDRVTGLFFDEQTPEALQEAVERFSKTAFHPELCRAQAERFGVERFCSGLRGAISELIH